MYKFLKYTAIAVLIFWLFLIILFRPSHDRDWELGQEKLPHIEFSDGKIIVKNFRNFDWLKEGEAVTNYETRIFNEDDLNSVDVFISHFSDFEGLAHIFISFGFKDNEHLVVSLETRREKNEEFSPLLGILRQYEIIYVVGSESDIVGLRTDVRRERVYLYDTKATPKQARDLFKVLAVDINDVYNKPRIYNTLTNNCTNGITRRVEDVTDIDFPLSWKTILPGYFDEVLYKMKIIDTSSDFTEVKNRHLIDNDKVDKNSPDYSLELRRF